MANNTKKLGVIALASVVVSSMVGGGIYSLPQNMAAQASVGAVIIAWVVTGIGMFFLANSFRILSDIRPDLKAGIYMYGREGFGSFVGFLIAWGYWLCQIFGNVGYAVITMDALNYFFPPYFAGGNTIYAIIGGSILIWLFNFVVLRGTQQAAVINTIGTIGKLIPLFVFIIIMIFVFHIDKFDFDFFGKLAVDNGQHLGGLGTQIKSTMLVTLWAFIGIEGAVVLSDRAQSQDDVGKATIMGFVGCLVVYVPVVGTALWIYDPTGTGRRAYAFHCRCAGTGRRPMGKLDYEHWVDHCGSGQLACLDIDHSGNAFCRGKKRNLSTPVL